MRKIFLAATFILSLVSSAFGFDQDIPTTQDTQLLDNNMIANTFTHIEFYNKPGEMPKDGMVNMVLTIFSLKQNPSKAVVIYFVKSEWSANKDNKIATVSELLFDGTQASIAKTEYHFDVDSKLIDKKDVEIKDVDKVALKMAEEIDLLITHCNKHAKRKYLIGG